MLTQIEPILVDVLSNGVRRSPVTHKLGVLYIIDSITRQWVAAGAAHAGGVRRMTDNLPVLMNELLPVVPENQKVSFSRLDCDNVSCLVSSNLTL
jgi:protein NRD1